MYHEPSTDTLIIEDTSDEEVSFQEEEEENDNADSSRWELTAEEKQAIRALKDAADDEGLYYKNLLELCKYVLVVQSLEKTIEKRQNMALKRLRKRHAWLHKHELLEIDEVEAHEEIAVKACPQHFLQSFVCERASGRAVVATHMAHVPLSYIQQSEAQRRKFLRAAMYRMDLGAVDLQEARAGMCLATISQGQLGISRAWRYMRFMNCISADMKDMHPHTVRGVHAQFPSLVAHLLPAIKHLLPRKVADRIFVYANVEEMGKRLEMGHNNDTTAVEWARQRQERYDETVAKLSLD